VRVQPPENVLNAIPSPGKSTIARHLQLMLDDTYLTFGVDTLLAAMPTMPSPQLSGFVAFEPDGGVSVGPDFRTLEAGWYAGLAAMAGTGVGLVFDEVFLGGAGSQARLAAALVELDSVWVAVTCDLEVATARARQGVLLSPRAKGCRLLVGGFGTPNEAVD
jgi:chloramphenicol 3-O phosphotransferase